MVMRAGSSTSHSGRRKLGPSCVQAGHVKSRWTRAHSVSKPAYWALRWGPATPATTPTPTPSHPSRLPTRFPALALRLIPYACSRVPPCGCGAPTL